MPLLKSKLSSQSLTAPLMGIGLFVLCATSSAHAQEYKSITPNYNAPSTTLTGVNGLNLTPTSRMDKVGTIRIGSGTTDPYLHAFLGLQIAKPLYINLRQTYEVSSLTDSAKHLYPGLDFKLKIMNETAKRPEVAIGANSAFGHKRTASEYIVFSKRKNNFDFSGGVAWGRLAGKGHIKNPLSAVSSHFDKPRNFNDESSQSINNWLTGKKIGFFGGVEYFTPLKGLSLKADYAPIDYTAEQFTNAGFDAPKPWSFGLNYKPFNYQNMDISAGIIGSDKVFARLSLQNQIHKWKGKPSRIIEPLELLSPRPNNSTDRAKITVDLTSYRSTGMQIGHAARHLSNSSLPDNENIEITLNHKGLKGPKLKLIRHDLEDAILHNHGSAEEIWRDVTFHPNETPFFKFKKYFTNKALRKPKQRYIFDNKISLSEEDSGVLYRSSLMLELEKQLPFGFKLGYTPRINIADNIGDIKDAQTTSDNPIRSNEYDFSSNRFAMDQLYISWLHSLNENTHVKLSAGYLEEMFGGFGGEILYRPFGKTFAIGAEAWQVKKRDGNSPLSLETEIDKKFTGHLNLFYELPNKETTIFTKIGQYLNEDLGATFGITNHFKNGTKLEGFITTTDQKDIDILGGTKNLYGGLKITLPFGNIPYVPEGSEMRLTTAPFARDAGQALNAPDPLYNVTEPIAYRNLSQSWPDLLD